jgi:hypothetical protein
MVEPGNLITIFFGKFESPYVGSPFLISGNQIYSAIIQEKGLDKTKDIEKVSHGIFHSIPPELIDYHGKITYNKQDWMGWHVADKINLNEKSIKSYNQFFALRSYQTPFIKDSASADYDRLMRYHRLVIKSGEIIDAFHADRLSFFVVGGRELELDELRLGAKRNAGFGIFRITNRYSFGLDSLDFSEFGDDLKLIGTAKSGITGILNHAKYGYGEFKLEKWRSKGWLVRLTTPLCLESTIKGSRRYTSPPSFMKSEGYRKHTEFMWRKGRIERLYCVSDGSVFLYEN